MTDVTSAAVSAPCEVPEDASEAAVAAVHEVPDHFYEDAAATVEVTDADREAAAGLFARLLVAVASQRNVANEMQQIVDVFHRRTTPLAVAAFECFRLSHLPMAVKLLSDSADDLIRGNLMSMMLWYATCVYRISGLDMLAEYMAVGLPAALCKVILSRGVVTAELAFNECFESEYRRLMPPQLRGEVDVWRHVVELVVDTNSLSQIGVSRCADLLGEIIYDSIQSTPLLEVVPMFPAVVSAIMPVLRQRKRSVNTVANVSKLMPFVAVANNGGCDFSLTWALIDGGACAWCINQLKRFNHVGGRMDVVATAINMVAQICEAVDDRFPCPAWKCVVCVAGPSHPGTPTPSCLTDRFPPPPGGDADDVDLHVSTSAEADAFIQRHLVDAGAGAAVAHAMDEMAAVWMTECKHGHSHLHPCVFRMFCDASSRLGRHSADFVRHFGAAPVAYRPTAYEVLAALVVEVATRVGVQMPLLRSLNALLASLRQDPPTFLGFFGLLERLAHGILLDNGTFGAPEEFMMGGHDADGGGHFLLLAAHGTNVGGGGGDGGDDEVGGDVEGDVDVDVDGGDGGDDDGNGDGDGGGDGGGDGDGDNLEEPH